MRCKNGSVKVLLVFAVFCFGTLTGSAQPSPPEAYFTVSPSSGQVPLTVSFDASGSYDIDGTIASYSWSFGDGETGSGKRVTHTYKKTGTFSPVLTVTDDFGDSSSTTLKVTATSVRTFYVTVTSDHITIGQGEKSTISINVTGRDGSPIPGATVKLIPPVAAKTNPDSGLTDSSGHFTSTFSGPLGKYRISIIVNKDGYSTVLGEVPVEVINKRPFSVLVTSEPASVGPGGTSAIKVIAAGRDGKPVPGASVTFISPPNGEISPESGQTDLSGQFTSTFTAKEEGKATIRALITKTGFVDGSGEVQVEVRHGNSYILLVLIVFVVSAASAYYLRTTGKLQLIPAQDSMPCDGKSTLPIKIQFLDPTGKPLVQKKNCVIALKATSGTVQNAVIPAGKESAEAILTSSTECGPVTVTAKSGIQKAKAEVNFVTKEAGLSLDISPSVIPADGISISSIVIKMRDDKGNFITPLNDRTVELTTTLGTITNPVTIPAKTLAGVAILTSGHSCGTATVTAVVGALRGEGKIKLEELAERYCMHCGTAMKRVMQSCPECKKAPISGTDIKTCYSCSMVIPVPAQFCDKCGAKQPV